MPKMYFPGESVGRDGRNAPSPGNPASYPIAGLRRLGLTRNTGGGVFALFINSEPLYVDGEPLWVGF